MAAYEYTARDMAGNEIRSIYTNVESVRALRRELVKLGYVLVRARRQRGSLPENADKLHLSGRGTSRARTGFRTT